jgi:hypothetical protein
MGENKRNQLCPCGSGKKSKKCCKEKHGASQRFDIKDSNKIDFKDFRQFGEDHMDFQDLDFMSLLNRMAEQPLIEIEHQHKRLIDQLKGYKPVETAISLSSLLTIPDLQSNYLRIETLILFALTYCRGEYEPTFQEIQQWFYELNESQYSAFEDPAEDVFVGIVHTQIENYRILTGIQEGNAFYVQRLLNVLYNLPTSDDTRKIRKSVESLLALSDSISKKATLERFEIGCPLPVDRIESSLEDKYNKGKLAVCFSTDELRSIGLEVEHLDPFVLDLANCQNLKQNDTLNMGLETTPLAKLSDKIAVLLPSGIGTAVRRYILKSLSSKNYHVTKLILDEYQDVISHTPLLKKLNNLPFYFKPIIGGYISTATAEVDPGRYIHFIFVVHNLPSSVDIINNFTISKIKGAEISEMIKNAYQHFSRNPNFKHGISLVVGCGWGDGISIQKVNGEFSNWNIDYLSASDLITISYHREISPLTLFRLYECVDQLNRHNIQIMNINGLPNLYAHVINHNGNILTNENLPDGFGLDGQANILSIYLAEILNVRAEVLWGEDIHIVEKEDGSFVRVRRDPPSIFDDDQILPLYTSVTDLHAQRLCAVYETDERHWWIEVARSSDRAPNARTIEQFRMLQNWICRAAPVLERRIPTIPIPRVTWKVSIEDMSLEYSEDSVDVEDLRELLHVSSVSCRDEFCLTINSNFSKALANTKNIAESLIVEKMIEGVLQLTRIPLENALIKSLLNDIVPNEDARQIHGFVLNSFRDYFFEDLSKSPIFLNDIDKASARIAMTWRHSEIGKKNIIEEKNKCIAFLNNIVTDLEDKLCARLKTYRRSSLIKSVLHNHERAAYDKALWRRTSKALLALKNNPSAVYQKILDREQKLNGVFLTTRVLIEAAICECPTDNGMEVGKLDIAQLMVLVDLIVHLGEWSNLIHLDSIEPKLFVTPTGDIRADLSIFDEIIQPYSKLGTKKQVLDVIERYDDLYKISDIHVSTENYFPQDFLKAWSEEFSFKIDEGRDIIDALENIALSLNKPIYTLSFDELIDRPEFASKKNSLKSFLYELGSIPRGDWREIPYGFLPKDRLPWRFGRRFSLLRRPIIHLTDGSNPTLLFAPGLIREAFAYTLSNYFTGQFQHDQVSSNEMRRWAGKIAKDEGDKFNELVNGRMSSFGWQTRSNIKVSEILGVSQQLNFGDVDVLAWDTASRRVLLMECKDLKFAKTPREIVDQMYKYRGTEVSGKRDDLKRHLDRIEVLESNKDTLRKFLRIEGPINVEGHLVFSKIVPMQFAWDRLRDKIEMSVFDELIKFKIPKH